MNTNKLFPFMLKGNASGDLNTIEDGIYAIHSGSPITNGPSDITLGQLLSFSANGYGFGGNPKTQIITYANNNVLKVYMRSKWSNVWTYWTSII